MNNLREVELKLFELEKKLNLLSSRDLDLHGRRVVNTSPSMKRGQYVTREELYQFQDKTSRRIQSLAEDIPVVQAPNAPTGVTLTIVDASDTSFYITATWTIPSNIGGTVGYQWEARYYSDSGGTTPITDWIPLGTYSPETVNSGNSGPHSKDTVTVYCKVRVAGYNANNEISSWAESNIDSVSPASGTAIPAPTQPSSSDWTIDTPIYRADPNGNQFVRVRTEVLSIPSDADYVEFFLNTGDGYKPIGIKAVTGISDHWEPQPTSAATWYVKMVASKFSYVTKPDNDTIHPPKSISVSAWKGPLQLTSGTCTLQEMTWLNVDGKKRYRLKHTATGPSDDNRQAIRVYRRWTDSSWTPAPGEPGNWGVISGVAADSGTSWTWYTAEIEGFPAPDTVTNYNQIAYIPVNHAGEENWTSPLTFNISFSPDGGFSATAIDPSTLGLGIALVNNQLTSIVNTDERLVNGDFEADSNAWSLDSGWQITTTDAYLGKALWGNGNSVVKYASSNKIVVHPGRIYRVTAYARSSLTGGTAQVFFTWWDASDAFLSATENKNISGDTYTDYVIIGTAPSNARYVRVSFVVPAAATAGRVVVDNVTFMRLEPVSGGLYRTATGGLYIDAVEISKLTAGTATFTGDATFQRTTGGRVTINGSGVVIDHLSYSDYKATFTVGNLKIEKISTSEWAEINYASVRTNGVMEAAYVFLHTGSIVSINNKPNWRTALGLATTTLYYKDHSGANQTLSNVVYVP